METKIKKGTYLSFLFFVIAILIYFVRYFIDGDYYRNLLSYMTLYVFYPSLLISIFLSIRNLGLINSYKELVQKKKWIILNCLSIIFVVYFIIKMILVMAV